MNYYGVTRSDEYLAHYGVKGMKWGVRKAIEKGDKKRLERHYKKANRKLNRLKEKADVIYNLDKRRQAPLLATTGLIPASAGVGLPILAKKWGKKLDTSDKVAAAFNALAGTGLVGIGVHDFITGGKRTKTKGHNKAVKKVNEWQKEMKNAFKGTKYEKQEAARPEFKDEYTLYEHGILGKDKGGRNLIYRAPTVTVKGSSIVRDKNELPKSIFKTRLTDSPQTQGISDSKVFLAVHTPSGRVYSADDVNRMIKLKRKRG